MITNSQALLTMEKLRIEGLSGESWTEIVKGVDLTLKRGEILGLIGESGAGKSTIGLAAMGFTRDGCRISGGKILFDGIDILSLSHRRRVALRGKRIAYVAQSAAASFNPAYKLIDQYCEAPRLHHLMGRRQAEADAIALYTAMRLPNPEEIGFRYPHQVSGGQLQRAMTAMAMACRPDLIIFDEPTTALDVTTQIEVLAAIRSIVRKFDTAAIYITHDVAVVTQMANRIKVLLRGEQVEEAETRVMLANPVQEYTKSLLSVRSLEHAERPSPPSHSVPVCRVEHIYAAYGKIDVLFDVNFDLWRNRTVAVVGESGSGKSTTARVIAGLLPPKAGRIVFDGKVLAPRFGERTKGELRQIQMIYQSADTSLNPKHRVLELIGRPAEFYLGLKGTKKRERVRELLSLIELEPEKYIDRFPSELSGGQKQRIGIARALAASPQVIICDEVTSALDQLVEEGLLKLLERLQREFDLAYMFITHDLKTVRAIADDVVVMKEGRVIEQGTRAQIFNSPHHPDTELLLSCVPEMNPGWLDKLLQQREFGTLTI
jgi:peptide/nickel transport system ATP-binding protein